MPDNHHKNSARAASRPINRLIAPFLVIAFSFCAVCAYLLMEARRTTYERAAEVATSMAAAVVLDIARNIETADLSLQAVVDNLKLPEIERLDPTLRRLVLFDRSAMARNMGRLVVLDEAGNVRLDASTPDPPPLDLGDRDYFQVHKDSANVGMYIGRPVMARGSGYWLVALSRRLSHPDGSFAGVVVASMRLSYFEELFKNLTLGPDGNITLSRTDGIVLMRWPFKAEYIGRDLSHSKLHEELAKSRSGRFETYAASDGVYRLIVYSQIGDLPLVIGVGQSTADIYAPWREFAFGVAFMLALISVGTVTLVIYLGNELNRRKEAEMKLAALAATDGLTSLANRRHFNETISREWQRALREKSPLALMMIDADKFKTYNDTHGHQAGDALLNAIGVAIASSLARGGDTGARYGGDEFAILLPGTSAEGAEIVAQKLRQVFAGQCEKMEIVYSGLSIGIACMTPGTGERFSALVGLADLALYRAKHLGRDRTEVAARDFAESATGPAADRHKVA